METWLIIYDKYDLSFSLNFRREIGFQPYYNFIYLSYDRNNASKIANNKLVYDKILIALWDTNEIIKCVSHLNSKQIFSVSTTDLTPFAIKKTILFSSSGYFIDLCNETLYGKVSEIAIPIETISCYDYDNKRSSCLSENTKISYLKDAGPSAYLPAYGIEKDTQWRDRKEDALEFSNLALREALMDKKYLKFTEDKYIVTKDNKYGSYCSFQIELHNKIELAFAGIIEDNGELEIDDGSAAATLMKYCFMRKIDDKID